MNLREGVNHYWWNFYIHPRGVVIYPYQKDLIFSLVVCNAVQELAVEKSSLFAFNNDTENFSTGSFESALSDLGGREKIETATYKIACGLQNSNSSLKEAMRVIQAINLYKGGASVFLTLSDSSHRTPYAEKSLAPEGYDFLSGPFRSRQDLVLHNPVVALEFTREHFEQCFNVLNEIHPIEWKFIRNEFQQRGSVHAHSVKFRSVPNFDSIAKRLNYLETRSEVRMKKRLCIFRNISELKEVIDLRNEIRTALTFYEGKVTESIPDPYYEEDFPSFDRQLLLNQKNFQR